MITGGSKQPAGLLSVLRSRDAPFGDRDDAAMDLAAFDEMECEEALIGVILDAGEDPDLVDRAAESLGEIWARKRSIDRDVLNRMSEKTSTIVGAVLDNQWPEWRHSRNA